MYLWHPLHCLQYFYLFRTTSWWNLQTSGKKLTVFKWFKVNALVFIRSSLALFQSFYHLPKFRWLALFSPFWLLQQSVSYLFTGNLVNSITIIEKMYRMSKLILIWSQYKLAFAWLKKELKLKNTFRPRVYFPKNASWALLFCILTFSTILNSNRFLEYETEVSKL